jgi:hypothetical protein
MTAKLVCYECSRLVFAAFAAVNVPQSLSACTGLTRGAGNHLVLLRQKRFVGCARAREKVDRVRKIAAAPLRTLSAVARRFCTPYTFLTQ